MTNDDSTIDLTRQEEAVLRAGKAAQAGDALGLVAALSEARALDGLARRLRRQWPGLQATDVEAVVALAVDDLQATVASGEKVGNVMGWLFKVSHRKASRVVRPEDPLDQRGIDLLAAERWRSWSRTESDQDDLVERRRAEAIRVARGLMPRLGQKNVQDVTTYLIDAVEAGRADLPHREVAEALGLSEGTVRVSMKRGLDRLARIARAEGLVHEDFSLVLGGDGDEEET